MVKIIKGTGLVIFVLLVVLFATIAFASGMFMSKKYLDPWQKDYYKGFDDIRLQVASQGLLAPNGHNMQPWKIKLDSSDKAAFYLYGDSNLLTPDVDPPARQFTITQGAFLQYCSVAASHLGYNANITLFPNGEYDGSVGSIKEKPVAKVILKKSSKVTDSALHDALFLPDTSRVAYQSGKLSDSQVEKLKQQNITDNLILNIYQDTTNMDKISRYVVDSAKIEGSIKEINNESVKLTRTNEYQKNKYRYGFSLEGDGTSGLQLYTKEALVTLFPSLNNEAASQDAIISQAELAVKNTPAYAFIITKDNSRKSQVEAGLLYSRVQLEAETMGLAVQPLSQSIEEYPQMSDLYLNIHNDYAPEGATIQMLFRLGKPLHSVPCSMRRDVNDLLIK
jgi:hypothetical protein